MSTQYFYSAGNERKGPVSEDEIRHLLQNGKLNDNTLIWAKELGTWQQATDIFPEYKGMTKNITGVCPICGYDIQFKKYLLGKEMACPLCREKIIIDSEKRIEFHCPYCECLLNPEAVVCRNCKKRVDFASVNINKGKALTSAAIQRGKEKLHSVVNLFKRHKKDESEGDSASLETELVKTSQAEDVFYYSDASGTPIEATFSQLPELLENMTINSNTYIWNGENNEWEIASTNILTKQYFSN